MSEKDRQVIKTKPARLWSRARQRLVETDHISFLPSKQSRLLRKRTKRNDQNWRSCRSSRKKKRQTKETTKTKPLTRSKETEDEMTRNVDFTSYLYIFLGNMNFTKVDTDGPNRKIN